MEHHRLGDGGHSHAAYGTISPVKQMKHMLAPPIRSPQHRVAHGSNLNEPSSGSLHTNVSFLAHGGRIQRDRVSRYLDHSAFGVGLDVVMALVSVTFVGAYITNTYIPANPLPPWLWGLEIFCALCFLVDYCFRGVFLADHRLDFVLSLPGLTSLAVILPVLPASFFLQYHTLWYDASAWRFVYPLRFLKCYLDLKAVLSRCHPRLSPVRMFAMLCYLQIILIIAGAAGIIQIAETSDGTNLGATDLGEWTFFNAFFNSVLVFVTIQTPPADNPLAKVFVGVLVIVLILVVPYQVARVLDLDKTFSPFELVRVKTSPDSRLVVLCGDLTPSRIDHFFREVFHDDHDQADLHVVVLSEDEPATAMRALLMDPFFEKRVGFVLGSILDADDARRAAVDSADAIFVLSRRFAEEDHSRSDHRTLMRVMAARRLAPSKARVFAQMHLSRHRHLLADLDVHNVLYFSEVIHSLLGQNCVCPGFSTFMYSLTASSSIDDDAVAAAINTDTPGESDDAAWEARYRRGSSHEVYSVHLPPAAVVSGKTFAEVASLVYAQCAGVVMFAVETGGDNILLNPGDSYKCVGDETVFVIAEDRRMADAVTNLAAGHEMAPEWSSGSNRKTSNSAARGSAITISTAPSKVSTSSSTTTASDREGRRKSRLVNWQVRLDELEPLEGSMESLKVRRPKVEDAVVDSVLQLELAHSPIVVCVLSPSTFPNHLEYLIGPLRVRSLRIHRPIIVLTPTLPTVDEFEGFQHFRDVHLVQGDPFRLSALQSAGVERAFRIVIMGSEGEIDEAGSSELLEDASCIALHKTISTFIGPAHAPRIIAELVNRVNVHFISQNLAASHWFSPPPDNDVGAEESRQADSTLSLSRDFFVSPSFAAGLAYSTSLCDSLLINQYFNRRIKSILREFIFASWRDEDFLAAHSSSPRPASDPGSRVVSPAWASVPTPAATVSGITSPLHHHVQRCSLFAVEVPRDFVGKTFAFVFHYLLSSDGILALGLYRCRPDLTLQKATDDAPTARIEVDAEYRSVPFGFVYVNPFPNDTLTGNDLLYVLSDKQPFWA